MPFKFSDNVTEIVEFGDDYVRFYKKDKIFKELRGFYRDYFLMLIN
jgi:hypothetical protein